MPLNHCSICFGTNTFQLIPEKRMSSAPLYPDEQAIRDTLAADCMARMWTEFCDGPTAATQNPKAMPSWAKRTAQLAFVAADAFIEVRREARYETTHGEGVGAGSPAADGEPKPTG